MSRIVELRSGGQSGADRGAMDAARACGVTVSGWCPAGGWAEDYPDPPGVLALYPEMLETPSAEVIQRTEWNIRDSTCSIIFNTMKRRSSPGTDAGYVFSETYGTPYFEIWLDGPDSIDVQLERAIEWLESFDDDAIVLGFGGPRASEYQGIYTIAFDTVRTILTRLAACEPVRVPVVVGISGGSGAGKTTFAELLRSRLSEHVSVVVIAQDSYYKNISDVPRNSASEPNFDTPDAIDTGLLVEHVRALRAQQSVQIPSYDFLTHTRGETMTSVEPTDVIIVEGLFTMCSCELQELFDLSIFMDGDDDVRAVRRLVRDVQTRGISLEDAAHMYFSAVKPAYTEFVAPCKAQADIVVCDALDENELQQVVRRIDSLLAAARW